MSKRNIYNDAITLDQLIEFRRRLPNPEKYPVDHKERVGIFIPLDNTEVINEVEKTQTVLERAFTCQLYTDGLNATQFKEWIYEGKIII